MVGVQALLRGYRVLGLAVPLMLGACGGGGALSEGGAGLSSGMAGPVAGAGRLGGATPVSAPANERGYILGAGDKVRILVFNEAEMSREYEVDSAGKVTLPLVGAVPAGGITPSDLQETIRTKLSKGFIRDPKVSVEVLSYRPFYIIGEVSKAGEYPYKNGINAVSAVAVAGGYTYRADVKTIYIRRANESAERPYSVETTPAVGPGDIVRVPERYF